MDNLIALESELKAVPLGSHIDDVTQLLHDRQFTVNRWEVQQNRLEVAGIPDRIFVEAGEVYSYAWRNAVATNGICDIDLRLYFFYKDGRLIRKHVTRFLACP